MKLSEWLTIVASIGRLFLILLEIRKARRDNDGPRTGS